MHTSVRSSVTLPKTRSFVSASGLRLVHSYVSAFIAPMVLFFATSGSLQIFGLHVAHGAYAPSRLISSMARLHKDQVFAPEPQRPDGPPLDLAAPGARPPGMSAPRRGHDEPQPSLGTLALKVLFLLEAIALVVTTLLGVWIGVTHPKRARTFWIVFAAGALIPIALIAV